jgi:hypothetical protein
VSTRTAQGIINDAIHLLNTRGWIQGAYGNPNEGYCLIGALSESIGYASSYHEPAFVVAKAVRDEIKERAGHRNVELFNDAPRRTKEEILDVLHKASMRLEMVSNG